MYHHPVGLLHNLPSVSDVETACSLVADVAGRKYYVNPILQI